MLEHEHRRCESDDERVVDVPALLQLPDRRGRHGGEPGQFTLRQTERGASLRARARHTLDARIAVTLFHGTQAPFSAERNMSLSREALGRRVAADAEAAATGGRVKLGGGVPPPPPSSAVGRTEAAYLTH